MLDKWGGGVDFHRKVLRDTMNTKKQHEKQLLYIELLRTNQEELV